MGINAVKSVCVRTVLFLAQGSTVQRSQLSQCEIGNELSNIWEVRVIWRLNRKSRLYLSKKRRIRVVQRSLQLARCQYTSQV